MKHFVHRIQIIKKKNQITQIYKQLLIKENNTKKKQKKNKMETKQPSPGPCVLPIKYTLTPLRAGRKPVRHVPPTALTMIQKQLHTLSLYSNCVVTADHRL